MSPSDAIRALQRHATSKITCEEDLATIRTLGFRGEALPAIASVSRMELSTATDDGDGFELRVEAGTVAREVPGSRARGTTVDVQELFYNTPARAKFMRTVGTELGRSTEIVHACALARPDVRFRLEHDGRELLLAPSTRDPRERIRQIFGTDVAEGMIPVVAGAPPLSLSGFISRPAFSRASRSAQFVFVNGRVVQDRTLSHAVHQACSPHFPRQRFPALFLFLELPPDQVDVNVHPAKREVRFRTPGAIHDLLRKGVTAALSSGRPVQSLPASEDGSSAVSDAVQEYLVQQEAKAPELGRSESPQATPAMLPVELPEEKIGVRMLGQFRDTYLIVEEDEGLLLVDQHAAHERIIYDAYRAELNEQRVAVQSLLFPVNVELPPSTAGAIDGLLGQFKRLGFAVELFGKNALLIREVPAIAAGVDAGRLVQDLVEQLAANQGEPNAVAELEHRVAALSACHAAVRAGMRLEPERATHIVQTLLNGNHAPTCPHGRPALLRYPLGTIERAFLRT